MIQQFHFRVFTKKVKTYLHRYLCTNALTGVSDLLASLATLEEEELSWATH